ncbi:hypothetical protein DAPPUDRAFT_233732 [Daphnia pulex]|uniref:Uncharacterized protein n=1 Tax=Daphnia pulex TaxID=6669 RepID=E9FVK2_DAPPU|nr:hypothetical protein DAPPUDRAFT_233732 [Daphnia pulex]|eukprot:EFX89091.1 hypothetical protein DAPPUDRAFT_233732 [Daphnia pulex]
MPSHVCLNKLHCASVNLNSQNLTPVKMKEGMHSFTQVDSIKRKREAQCDDDGRHMASFTRTAKHERAGVASENTERWSELRKGLGGEPMGKAIRPEYVRGI